jgi:hypothetical protein
VAWAKWLTDQPEDSLGYFSIRGEPLFDYGLEHGDDLEKFFAPFLHTPAGGLVGFWLIGGRAIAKAPIVHIGSEGEHSFLAPTLLEFLKRIAKEQTQVHDIGFEEFQPAVLRAFKKWLAQQKPELPSTRSFPDFAGWMQAWYDRHLAENDAIRELQRLGELLKKNVKGSEIWRVAGYRIFCIGKAFQVTGPNGTPPPQRVRDAIEELVRPLRLARAKRTPDRGLWITAYVKIYSSGRAMLSADYLTRPEVPGRGVHLPKKYIKISAQDLKADLKRYPRSERWRPDWFDAILSPPRPTKKEKNPMETVKFWLEFGFTRTEAKAMAAEQKQANADLAQAERSLAETIARFP